jgi:hypothetical protein
LDYFDSIYNCPLINYDKVIQTGDSRYLYDRKNWGNLPDERLDLVFDKIFWEYQEEKGLEENFKLSIEYKAKIEELKYREVTEGKGYKPQIARYETMLAGLRPKTKQQGISEKLAILSKYMGYQISPEITLIEYIGIEKLYLEYAKTSANRE